MNGSIEFMSVWKNISLTDFMLVIMRGCIMVLQPAWEQGSASVNIICIKKRFNTLYVFNMLYCMYSIMPALGMGDIQQD